MDADDEFGDLYSDIGPDMGKRLALDQYEVEKDGDIYDEDDEELLYGASTTTNSLAVSSKTPPLPPSSTPSSGLPPGLADKEVDSDERFLYGQLYGVTMGFPNEANVPVRRDGSKPIWGIGAEKREDTPDSRVLELGTGSSFSLSDEDRLNGGSDLMGRSLEIPLGGVSSLAGTGEKGPARDSVPHQKRIIDGFSNQVLSAEGAMAASRGLTHVKEAPLSPLPGFFGVSHTPAKYTNEEDAEGQNMRDVWEEGDEAGGEVGGEAENEDWEDSDSEDDLQIVLNDDTPIYGGSETPADGGPVEGSEDEDEDDLVIVAGDDNVPRAEEQEWEGEPAPTDITPGLAGAPGALGSDRPLGADERGPGGKGSGAGGVSPGVPRIGYSGQGYHTHHMQYKYVRPGAALSSAKTIPGQDSPQPTGTGGKGGPGAQTGGWGPGRGGAGRADWSSAAGRGSSGPRSQGGGCGVAPWGGSRGMEFNLPPTKTVFDVDLDSLEEKPWKRPGVDMTDYFNFGFSENTWKQYCRQLAQLRLEATMQSKIRVYESGRSEQDYDPDLPPELAAAAGIQDAGDSNVQQQRAQDGGPGGGGSRGRGAGRGRMMPPTGRAIQVEGGGGERRPSADVRRQRTRDSDAVIQIVLQDASKEEFATCPLPVETVNEDFADEDEDRGGVGMLEEERRFFRPGGPSHWEIEGRPNMWQCENMLMGPGGMPTGSHGGGMMPAHRMDVDCPGPFAVGPGMSMHQPGLGPNFSMFPGAPIGPPPVGRGGMVRPPMYSRPRPALPLPAPGPPAEVFPPMMPPLDYHEPPRRTPPLLSPPQRTLPQGLSLDWDEEPRNGIGANWNLQESRSKDYSGNGDWLLDSGERREGSFPRRDLDRATERERSIEEPSMDHRSDEQKRSISQDRPIGESDWDGGYSARSSKKQKVQMLVETRSTDYVHAKSQKSTAKEDPSHSWEYSKERLVEEEISQQRRGDAGHSKLGERKMLVSVDDSFATHRKESTRSSRLEEESKERRQHREREDAQRMKFKEEDSRQYCSREDKERERRSREDLDRDRRHAKREKEDERLSRIHRSKRHGDDHCWTSREREESRAREEAKSASAEREAERVREKRRRVEDRGKVKGRLDDRRDGDGRGRRHERDEEIRPWEDSRKYEEKRIRIDSGHVARNHSTESRGTVDEQRSHKDKRVWEGTAAKEMPTGRNESISVVGDERSYRSSTDGSKKRKVEEYRTSAQFEKASTRDSDELTASSARLKEEIVGPSKKGQDEYRSRRLEENYTGSRAHRGSKEEKSRPDIGSSEDEEDEQRGRSKLERWTSSKKERDTFIGRSNECRKKYQASDEVHEGTHSSSQHAGSDRQQRIRAEQEWKEDQKEKPHLLPILSGKRHSDADAKDSSVRGAADVNGNETLTGSQPAPAKDLTEKRKERIERLRLQAAERQKIGEDALSQPGSVEEVKPERPARKRRWAWTLVHQSPYRGSRAGAPEDDVAARSAGDTRAT
ncbi:hypothetical protein R1flu_008642 [Riccia fluitans]|uniref:Pre-mRNA polyadenylation factor Fip1 domain-containing protein n=1 Tax=Riccia fluitans TaxID=41844 RepID=A0ABD1YFE1_9MARC